MRNAKLTCDGIIMNCSKKRISKFTTLLSLSFLAIPVAILAAAINPTLAQQRLVYSSPLPQSEYGAQFSHVFAEEVAKATDGEVEILVRLNGVLGLKGGETLSAVRDGLVHIADMQMNQQVGDESIFGIESLPCLARDFEDLKTLQSITRPFFDDAAERHNQKILYIYPMPRQSLFARVDASDGPEALRGLLVRTIDKNGTEFFARLGAAPIQMPWAEVTPALSTGLLEGVSTSPNTAVTGTFWDFLSHVTELHWQMNSFMTTINLDAWRRLSSEHQAILEEVAASIQERLWNAAMEADITMTATLRKNGMSYSQPGPKLESAMQEVCRAMTDEYLAGSGAREAQIISTYKATSDAAH